MTKFSGYAGRRGFTLLELAIAVVIVGVVLAAAIGLYDQANAQRKIRTTRENMDTIVQALSVYAETAGRIPCPADPAATDITFGWERGVQANDLAVQTRKFPVGSCLAATRQGIVPFYTLGLSPETARDGWGNYFTYAVSPVFAKANDQSGTALDEGQIHGRCRHFGWISWNDDNKDGVPTAGVNRNAVKARFCCADQLDAALLNPNPAYDATTDLQILFQNGGPVISPARAVYSATEYNDINTMTVLSATENVPVMDNTAIVAPAFVLVSHGQNGLGAYLGNGTTGKTGIPASADELENANDNNIFVDPPQRTMAGGANDYDDIVRWMTQDGILAAHGALSCQYP